MTTTEAFAAIDRAALALATPQFIDDALAAIYGRYYAEDDKAEAINARLIQNVTNQAGNGARYYTPLTDAEVAKLTESRDAHRAAAAIILAEGRPFNAEFVNRGGWTRAYLVKNNGGHVHSSMGCQTCWPTTRFGWLTQMSGHTEAEIVDLAGEGACSVCYPTAPRIGRNRLELPADKKAREEREAAKAERKAKSDAKAIGPLTITVRGYTEKITTIAAAWAFIVGDIANARAYSYTENQMARAIVFDALRERLDMPAAILNEKIEAKVVARIKREATAR